MNLPNWVTVARIALVPLFVFLAYGETSGQAFGAFLVFGVASGSDSLDGYLARSRGQISALGQFLDPLADKLLVGAALFVLVDTRDFPLWAALLIAVREVAVQVLRTRIVRAGGTLPASAFAKFKTFTQLVMVCWWLLPWDGRNAGHWVTLGVAVAWTLGSGFEYFRDARKPMDAAL